MFFYFRIKKNYKLINTDKQCLKDYLIIKKSGDIEYSEAIFLWRFIESVVDHYKTNELQLTNGKLPAKVLMVLQNILVLVVIVYKHG